MKRLVLRTPRNKFATLTTQAGNESPRRKWLKKSQNAEQEPVQPEEEILASDDEDDAMEVEEANANWGAKDPRAGGVDVVLVQLKPNYAELADMLFRIASDKAVRPKNRKSLYNLVKW